MKPLEKFKLKFQEEFLAKYLGEVFLFFYALPVQLPEKSQVELLEFPTCGGSLIETPGGIPSRTAEVIQGINPGRIPDEIPERFTSETFTVFGSSHERIPGTTHQLTSTTLSKIVTLISLEN